PTPPDSPTVKDKKKRKSRRRRSSTSSSDSVDDVDPMPNLDAATWNIVKNIPFFTGQAGSTSFKAWIRMFMRWAEGQKWSDSTKLCIFLMKMRGEAAEAANELTPAERKSWSLTKSAMLARYKVVISIDAMRNAFKNRKMDESKEDPFELGNELMKLYRKANPKEDPETEHAQRELIDTFCEA